LLRANRPGSLQGLAALGPLCNGER